jgi:hypothetical protein
MRTNSGTELPPPEILLPREEKRARLIAFYLPQFHPISQNDEWWGKGFTEWTNVAKARPLFAGHYQPHLPADLGFYDLRLPETRSAQATLAREHGVYGFCYYHYWFNGRRLLERPFNEVLASREPDFPFCLCWANEPWSRRWLGEEREVLMPQTYSLADHKYHAQTLAPMFADPRYIRANGRPVFVVYRPSHIPELESFVETFSEEVERLGGAAPYLIAINNHNVAIDYRKKGFQTEMQFEPSLGALPEFMNDAPSWSKLRRNIRLGVWSRKLKLYRYRESRRLMASTRPPRSNVPCIFVGWDNCARRGGNGIIFTGCSPDAFEAELKSELDRWQKTPKDTDLFFINAWNEWAEGNYLEPNTRFGRGYLEAVKRCSERFSKG